MDGIEWNWMGWDGIGWDAMELDGMGWEGRRGWDETGEDVGILYPSPNAADKHEKGEGEGREDRGEVTSVHWPRLRQVGVRECEEVRRKGEGEEVSTGRAQAGEALERVDRKGRGDEETG